VKGHRTLASVVDSPKIGITGAIIGWHDEIVQAMFKLDKQISCKIQQRAPHLTDALLSSSCLDHMSNALLMPKK
jgi:hypothetical protein